MAIEIYKETEVQLNIDELRRLAEFVLEKMFVAPGTDASIIFVEEKAMAGLNEEWMGQDYATDVLSFPMDELRPGKVDTPSPAGLLGDIVICPEVAKKQADAAGHSLEMEIYILLVHGFLHLLGFDHATPSEEAEMFGLQDSLLFEFLQEIQA